MYFLTMSAVILPASAFLALATSTPRSSDASKCLSGHIGAKVKSKLVKIIKIGAKWGKMSQNWDKTSQNWDEMSQNETKLGQNWDKMSQIWNKMSQ